MRKSGLTALVVLATALGISIARAETNPPTAAPDAPAGLDKEFLEQQKAESKAFWEAQKKENEAFRSKQMLAVKDFMAKQHSEAIAHIQASNLPDEKKAEVIKRLEERWAKAKERHTARMTEGKGRHEGRMAERKAAHEAKQKDSDAAGKP